MGASTRVKTFAFCLPAQLGQQAQNDLLQSEAMLFDFNILKRFHQSKSASKRCSHCDSVISKKSRMKLTEAEYLQDLKRFTHRFDRQDYVKSLIECPACHKNLLATATDLAKKASLAKRLQESSTALTQARQAHLKNIKAYGYVVVACVPC